MGVGWREHGLADGNNLWRDTTLQYACRFSELKMKKVKSAVFLAFRGSVQATEPVVRSRHVGIAGPLAADRGWFAVARQHEAGLRERVEPFADA